MLYEYFLTIRMTYITINPLYTSNVRCETPLNDANPLTADWTAQLKNM
jgi:hypothetical protein